MNQPQSIHSLLLAISRARSWFAWNLGVDLARKEEVYLDIARSVTLTDSSYWLQVIFSAGIATLGLVLNSPAVIIGAMLISPLMGSILANGLALAAGDVILALRAICNLILSCMLAIAFAIVLVSILPFKEMTSEILARTQPNLLDLGVALFSGAVGAVAICKEAKGVATSIPGVSIAVALMPPLCVVGYGIGIAVSANPGIGFQVARGGGLLFFTNLVAITFSAMIVFLALHIDIEPVPEQVRVWRVTDRESAWVQSLSDRIPAASGLKRIGSLPGRLLLILATILLISMPLAQSFGQLRSEIISKQQENQLRNAATDVWQKNFATSAEGQARSYINQLSFQDRGSKLGIQLRVFTNKLYTDADRAQYQQLLALKLLRPLESIAFNLVEIPTATNDLLRQVPEVPIPAPPTIGELQSNLLREIETVLNSLKLPDPAQRVSYTAVTSPDLPLKLQIVYLSERDIDRDGRVLLVESIRTQLNAPTAQVILERIAPTSAAITFPVDRAAARSTAISTYLQTQGIPANQLSITTTTAASPMARLQLVVKSAQLPAEPQPIEP